MKIAVAMSGGLDSTVTALLLRDEGHEIIGITAKMKSGLPVDDKNPFFSDRSIYASREIADRFSFPHHIIDIEEDFFHQVIAPFCDEYLRGRTPNPCIFCNPRVKYKGLIEYAESLGCDRLATGHYAGLDRTAEGRYFLTRGIDPVKDQSYFLYRLPQKYLSKSLFPLGGYHKHEVREIARAHDLAIADAPESQEICFVPDDDYARFITATRGKTPPPGNIVDTKGTVLGRHKGIHHYTIGQRRGLGIAAPRPLYVIRIDAASNRIIAGYREELDVASLTAVNICYMKVDSVDGLRAMVKTRSTQEPVPARLSETEHRVKVLFDNPQQGISPGQAAVFYSDEGHLLGGGTIESSSPD